MRSDGRQLETLTNGFNFLFASLVIGEVFTKATWLSRSVVVANCSLFTIWPEYFVPPHPADDETRVIDEQL